MEEQSKEEPKEKNEEQTGEEQTQTQMLTKIAREAAFFHDEQREAYAVVPFEDHEETLRVKGRDFRLWMIGRYFERFGTGPSREVVSRALELLEATALYRGDCHPLCFRVVGEQNQFYYDLADPLWRIVTIQPGGWEIGEHPYKFKRAGNTAPQLEPKTGGRLDAVLKYLNLEGEASRTLFMVWLVSCLVPGIPHPLLLLIGEKGAAKSTLARIIKRLVDPAKEELLSLPGDHNELALQLAKNYVASFDNLDGMQGWQSDFLARAITGGGITKRRLYTDDDEIILSFKRCIVLNGINPAVTRSDLLDRTIPIILERISRSKRRAEAEFWEAFEKDRPYILGAMLDILAKAMQIYPSVKIPELPRMADFCRWGYAIAEAMGIGGKTFQAMYEEAIEHQNEVAIDHHPVASAVRVFMEDKASWDGKPSGLLTELDNVAASEKIDQKSRSWPKAAHVLTKRLKEIKSNLADIGITFTETRTGASRIIVLCNANHASQASSASLTQYDSSDGTNDSTMTGTKPQASSPSQEYNDSNDASDDTFTTNEEENRDA